MGRDRLVFNNAVSSREADWLFSPQPLQAHILEYGLAVHEKVVPQDMRPLHKKLVDQFHLMKSSLGIQVVLDAPPHLFPPPGLLL